MYLHRNLEDHAHAFLVKLSQKSQKVGSWQ
jgi:hypothetical protein